MMASPITLNNYTVTAIERGQTQTGRQRQTDRQTGRQTHAYRHTQTETDRQTRRRTNTHPEREREGGLERLTHTDG